MDWMWPPTLSVQLPSGLTVEQPHGFSHHGAGTADPLVPISIDEPSGVVTFSVPHFSGVSLLSGPVIDCNAQLVSPTPEEGYATASPVPRRRRPLLPC